MLADVCSVELSDILLPQKCDVVIRHLNAVDEAFECKSAYRHWIFCVLKNMSHKPIFVNDFLWSIILMTV